MAEFLGVDRKWWVVGGVVGGAAFLWVVLKKKKTAAAASSSTTTVITGSTSSQTGISGQLLNAILKDWQQNPPSSSTATGTGTGTGTKTTSTGSKKTSSTGSKVVNTKGTGGGTTVTKHTSVSYTDYTVKKGQTLAEIAKQFGITPAQLAHSNVYVPGEAGNAKVGQTLGTGAGLKTGQVLKVPHYHTSG